MQYIIIILLSFGTLLHDYHIGLTEVNHNSSNKSLGISIRLFTEDLEKALNSGLIEQIELNIENETNQTDLYINTYLNKKFNIEVNKKEKEVIYLGKEYEEDVIWMYLEVQNVNKIKTIKVRNTLLTEVFDDQRNIINVNINNKKAGEILSNDSPSFIFK